MIISKFIIDKNIIDKEFRILNNILSQQRQLKKTLLLYLEKISDGIYNAIDPQDSNSLISCLNGIKKSFENIKENINQIIDLKNYLENLMRAEYLDTSDFDTYNERYMKLFEKITEDNIFYYSFMESLLKYMEVIFPNNSSNIKNLNLDKQIQSIINTTADENENSDSHLSTSPDTTEANNSQKNEYQKLQEKTLFVSYKNNKAILPYSIVDLEITFSNNPEQYSSIQDIIDKKYTISLSNYKNPAFARFREAFNLAKNKSKQSFIKSLDLANELFFNSELNPVIITACKNTDELDIYLSCLEDNELDEFKCFNIIYENTI